MLNILILKIEMRIKLCSLIFLFIGITMISPGQVKLQPVDSLYMNSLEYFYRIAENNMDDIWPGMKPSPVCLYRVNGPAFLFNHPDPPPSFTKVKGKLYVGSQHEAGLFGSTQLDINGTLTAIADYGREPHLDTMEVMAVLFHEMHHAYQQKHVKELDYENMSLLITYPENADNDAIKNYEQLLLFKMCFVTDRNSFKNYLDQFFSCRERRAAISGDYMDYEKDVESVEGPAFYSEYLFYKKFSECDELLKENYIQDHFFGILNTSYYGRVSLRTRHLASGMAMCYIIDRYYNNWQEEFYESGENLYDFFNSKFETGRINVNIPDVFFAMSNFYVAKEIKKHQVNYEEFNSQNGIRVSMEFNNKPSVRGFDPMNAEAINDSIILNKTLLRLINGDNSLFITNTPAVSVIGDEVWTVKRLSFFVEERSDIKYNGKRLVISLEGINVEWNADLQYETADSVFFRCY